MEGQLLAMDVFMLAVGIPLVWQSSIQLGLLELHCLPSVLYEIGLNMPRRVLGKQDVSHSIINKADLPWLGLQNCYMHKLTISNSKFGTIKRPGDLCFSLYSLNFLSFSMAATQNSYFQQLVRSPYA